MRLRLQPFAHLVLVENEVLELEVSVADLHRVAVRDGVEQLQEEALRHGLGHALVPLRVLVQVALRSMGVACAWHVHLVHTCTHVRARHVHGMCTACARHVHGMCTACAQHVHTACTEPVLTPSEYSMTRWMARGVSMIS